MIWETIRPKMALLSRSQIQKILSEAQRVLSKTGVRVENDEGRSLLGDAGCRIQGQTVTIPASIIEAALKTVPSSITLYDRDGDEALNLEGDSIHFDPGSAAIAILDSETLEQRPPCTRDLVRMARLTDQMIYIAAQSTSMVPNDVPKPIQDRYRLYLALIFCRKPIVTGTFSKDGFAVMKDLLTAVRGTEKALASKPLAIFDCCPSPPLKWSDLTCQNLIDCAKSRIPAELVSMPLTGLASPVTLSGALVQVAAENLSGIVIHQLARPGAPIIFGGSPAAVDMRRGTTPMGAVETMMIDSAYAQIGKALGLPTHAYMALSDAKLLDAQAGMETGMGAVLAALSGINVISGPGMLNFESCQSLEKLLLDNEICGMALRLVQGIEARGDELASDLYGNIYEGDHFAISPTTLRWFKQELLTAGPVLDRSPYDVWSNQGRKELFERARSEVSQRLSGDPSMPEMTIVRNLRKIMKADGSAHGISALPEIDPR